MMTAAQLVPEVHTVEPISGFTTIWGFAVNPSVIVLAIAIGTVVYALWRAQRDNGRNTFDVYDLIMDRMPDGTRRTSGIKTTYQFAFLLSSWVIIDKEIKGDLGEAVFGLYLGTWCASLIAKVVFDKTEPPKVGADK